jgi:hypothetical protein
MLQPQVPRQRVVKIVDMKVDDVELIAPAQHFFEREIVIRERISDVAPKPQRALADGHQTGACDRIAACEQRHLVSAFHQLFCQIRDNPLCSPVFLRRHALV